MPRLTKKFLSELIRRRNARRHQRKFRGDRKSANDLFEDATILLALEAGEITEGQATKALNSDRVSVRDKKIRLIELGKALTMELS